MLRTHHSIMDGSSLQVAVKDLGALYQALDTKQPHALPEQPIQYSDFAQWQHSQQQAGAWEPHLAFWKEELAGAPDALDLPADVPESDRKDSKEGHWLYFQLDAELADAMRALATGCQASLLALAIAAFQVGHCCHSTEVKLQRTHQWSHLAADTVLHIVLANGS